MSSTSTIITTNALVVLFWKTYPYGGHASADQAMLEIYAEELRSLESKTNKTEQRIEELKRIIKHTH